jgi:spore coat polysaccharide biosynthesis predicted glycosyltransferase SpsG
MVNCLFLVSVGKTAGLGHLMRSKVAAKALKRRFPNININFIVIGDQVNEDLLSDFNYESIDSLNVDLIASRFMRGGYHLLVLDLYKQSLGDEFQGFFCKVRGCSAKVVAIDGLLGFEDLIDLIYIPSFFQNTLSCNQKSKANSIYGWECYLIEVEAVEKSSPNEGIHILVLTGGSDVNHLGRFWPDLLNEIELDIPITIDWVVGPYSEEPVMPPIFKNNFVLHFSPKGLNELIQKADFSLTLYGVSFFELLKSKVPTVVYANESNDFEIEALEREDVAVIAKKVDSAVPLLKNLILDKKKTERISSNGWNKLKFANGDRFALEIEKLLDITT